VYISASRGADAASGVVTQPGPRSPRRRGRLRRGVSANVLALGAVSLVTDVSSEMVTAILSQYLVYGLGLSLFLFGMFDGLYNGVGALVRLVGGHAADRWQRRKLVAGVGYGLSAACKLGMLVVGRSVPGIGAVLALDRTGKGLRTAPRDALISLSSAPDELGRSFGVHRAMDTAGAFCGPLVAFGVLWATAGAYDAVFVVSFCLAAFAVLLLALFVRDHRQPLRGRSAVSLRAAFGLLRARAFRRVCLCAALLGLVSVSDAFVYLLLQRRVGVELEFFPLLPLGTAAVYLLSAVPLGVLADRTSRWAVFLGGHLALLAVYLLLLGPVGGPALLVAALLLHGLFYAATDGVLMAVAGPMLPEHLRGSGLGLVQTGQAVSKLLSSVLFGAAWGFWGMRPALGVAAAALGLAVAGVLLLMPHSSGRAWADARP
jgi:MFS family permease